MKKILRSTTSFILSSIMVLNFLSGFIGFFWLLIGGNWLICIISFFMVLWSNALAGIILLPAHFIILLKLEKDSSLQIDKLFYLALSCAVLAAISISTIIYLFYNHMVDYDFLIPVTLLSYSVSTSMWDYIATKNIHINVTPFNMSTFDSFVQESGFYILVALINKCFALFLLVYFIFFK